MAGRKTRPEVNRRRFHAGRVDQADTPKSKLWALCHWLVSESWQAGRINDTTHLIETHLNELLDARKEANTR